MKRQQAKPRSNLSKILPNQDFCPRRNSDECESNDSALVVFSGQTEIKWLRMLRPGFRHCFVLIQDSGHWLCLDPLSNRIELFLQIVEPTFDLERFYSEQGLVAIRASVRPALPVPAPLGLFTCVETVKRVLGIRHRWIITPRQLYKFLIRQNANLKKQKYKKIFLE